MIKARFAVAVALAVAVASDVADALAVVVAVALVVAFALAFALAFDLPGSLPQRRMDRGKTRRAAHMDVRRSRQGQDAPSANPRCIRGPGARSAEGAARRAQGRARFLLVTFSLREQRNASQQPKADQSNSPERAKAFAVA
ncbi:hypothetical protein NG831_20680 [Xanthomonas sacchari]|uniref:hypothetical protein n=1 Tax=Xanthomonas sacchari TaxID=56458 RepID=UPI0022533CE7|nr:hypothetical protein [Xanthomonas sacchari]UYK66482.1 hypothetical protein NG831_20680 [Xanthomonas sacchari]